MNANAAPPTSRAPLIWGVAIAVVVVLGIVAVVAARGSDDDGGTAAADQQQTSEVTVEGTALAPLTDQGDDPAVGEAIPTVTGEGFDGEAVTIGPDDGAKLIMVVAHWCPHCQKEVPLVMEHLADRPMPDDVELVMVSTSVEESADNYPPSAWLADEGWDGTVLADGTDRAAAAALGTGGFPYFVAVDAEGEVVARTSGEISMDQFDELVAAAQGDAS